MSFIEFTLTDPTDYCEVMVDINTETGKIVDLYCYADHVPEICNEETDHIYKINVKQGRNPLFVHILNKANVYRLLLRNGFVFLINEEDERYNEEIALIDKSLIVYDLSKLDEIY